MVRSKGCLVSLTMFVIASVVDSRCLPADRVAMKQMPKPLCPKECECHNATSKYHRTQLGSGLLVNCTKRGLHTIPDDLPPNTIELLLSENGIRSLYRFDLQGCTQLEKLVLTANHLMTRSIDPKSFATVPALREVYLDDNWINVESLPDNLFDGMDSLNVLHVHYNTFARSSSYNEQLFSRLVNLTELSLDSVLKANFGPGFAPLTRLESLNIYGGGLHAVRTSTFAVFNSSLVKRLKLLTRRLLTEIEPMSFCHFKHLEELDLSWNYQLTLIGASDGFRGLLCTKIKTLKLSRLNLRADIFVAESFYQFLNRTNVTYIDLSHNNIGRLSSMFARYLPHLEHIDLSHNMLLTRTRMSNISRDIWQLKKLKYLDVSYQTYIDQETTVGKYITNKTTDNNYSQTDNHRQPSQPNKSLNYCRAHFLLPGKPRLLVDFQTAVSEKVWCIPLPPRLNVVNVSQAMMNKVSKIPMIIFFGGSNLRLISCRENGLTTISGPIIFSQQTHDLTIDLSGNKLYSISSEVFKISSSLGSVITSLHLDRNHQLVDQVQNDQSGEMFRYLRDTAVLSLTRIGIENISRNIFQHLRGIQILDLSRNSIQKLDLVISHMKQLTYLDLTDNKVPKFSAYMRDQLSPMMGPNGTGLKIDLTANRLSCSCADVSFVYWIDAMKKNFVNFQYYHCSRNDSFASIVNFAKVHPPNLEYECSKRLIIVVSGSMLGLLFTILSISVVCYRYRWELRYSCLKLTQHSKRYQLLVNVTPKEFDYDAFVVYDSGDRMWVNEQLLPNIEQRQILDDQSDSETCRNVRLCVHERDFPPGEDIIGNIWNKMELSRKTILVLSNNFAKSHYCEYEAQLARMNSVEQARNLIVPVLLEPVDIKDMSECMSWIVRKLTYIEWPLCETDREEFWQKLLAVIADNDAELFRSRNRQN